MNYVILEKAKPYTRVKRGKLERVRGYAGRPGLTIEERKEKIAKEEVPKMIDKMSDVMKLYRQSEGMCGPASIRIALSRFQKSYTEEEIASIAKATASEGTDTDNLVKTVKSFGINVIEYRNVSKEHSLVMLREYISKKCPIIVSWIKTNLKGVEMAPTEKELKTLSAGEALFDSHINKITPAEDWEHYSVLSGIDESNVYLMDPYEEKEEKLPISYFMDRWWDTVDNRWFLVLTGEVK